MTEILAQKTVINDDFVREVKKKTQPPGPASVDGKYSLSAVFQNCDVGKTTYRAFHGQEHDFELACHRTDIPHDGFPHWFIEGRDGREEVFFLLVGGRCSHWQLGIRYLLLLQLLGGKTGRIGPLRALQSLVHLLLWRG